MPTAAEAVSNQGASAQPPFPAGADTIDADSSEFVTTVKRGKARFLHLCGLGGKYFLGDRSHLGQFRQVTPFH